MTNTDEVTIPLESGMRLVVPAGQIATEIIERMLRGESAADLTPAPAMPIAGLPKIGAKWQGGKYAGLTLHDNRPMALVLLPGDESMDWNDAVKWADKQGGYLPSRIDQLVLLQNLKAEFKEAYYWSGEQHASVSAYAWSQYFGDGSQLDWPKDSKTRVRAVRRFPI